MVELLTRTAQLRLAAPPLRLMVPGAMYAEAPCASLRVAAAGLLRWHFRPDSGLLLTCRAATGSLVAGHPSRDAVAAAEPLLDAP